MFGLARAIIGRSDLLNSVISLSLNSYNKTNYRGGSLIAEASARDLEKDSSVIYNRVEI